MAAAWEYIKEFFIALGQWIIAPWNPMGNPLKNFIASHPDGGAWALVVVFWVLSTLIVAGIVWLIVIFVRKHLRFSKKEIEKESLQATVYSLQSEIEDVTKERDELRDQLYKVSAETPADADEELAKARFQMLMTVDRHYPNGVLPCEYKDPEDANITLEALCERFRNFASSQMHLYYTLPVIRTLFAAMGSSRLLILEGISGTGKTSLPYALGRFFEHNATICPVQPSWRDRTELIGFYNEFTHKFTETVFLSAIYEATFRDDINLVVLDEMNLARIEYYFAEFLSIMEMPNVNEWKITLIAAAAENDPRHLRDGTLLIPQNIWFVGTANNDDSTFTITDKVYDRAMSMFFDNKGIPFEAPYTEALPLPYNYLNNLFLQAKSDHPVSETTLGKFKELDSFVIDHFKLAFGNRIMKQINDFVPCFIACGGTELGAFDYVFKSKILKKFEVLNVAFLRDELLALDHELNRLFGKGEFKMSHAKIKDFLKQSSAD